MAKRRGNNEGSIYQRKNGTWRAQVTVDGKRLSSTSKTRKECQAWLKETLNQIDGGLTFWSANLSVTEFIREWLQSVESTLRESTWVQYRQISRDYILPVLGGTKLVDLKPIHIQRLLNLSLESDLSSRTVRMIYSVFHNALNHAVRLGVLNSNPASVISPPKMKHKEMAYLDQGQVQRLLLIVQAKQVRYYGLYKLAITTGMRMGELLGLKWKDMEWERSTIKVQRQLKRRSGQGLGFVPPKSQAGIRTIQLGAQTLEIMRQHLDYQLQERMQQETRWQEHDLIFPSSVGTPTQPSKLLKWFKKLLKEAGLPEIRFHDLRHTAASLMLNQGIPVLVVSKRLGHSKPSVTLDTYGHLISSMQDHVAELMDDITTPVELIIAPQLHHSHFSKKEQ